MLPEDPDAIIIRTDEYLILTTPAASSLAPTCLPELTHTTWRHIREETNPDRPCRRHRCVKPNDKDCPWDIGIFSDSKRILLNTRAYFQDKTRGTADVHTVFIFLPFLL
jgi:hypothetical protein